ncbi:ankyrin repeat-containing domain protein [Aspergillus heterothallicus]
MEPVGVALGVLGLFSLYQEAASLVHSIKNYPSESLRLLSRFNATKLLFERWGKQVGVADRASLEKNTHNELQDPATVTAVASLLASIRDVLATTDPTLAKHDSPPVPVGKNSDRAKLRSRLKWALADNDKLAVQVKDFDELVQKLYHLVPPTKVQPDEFKKLQETLMQSQRGEALRRVSQWLDATTTENTFDAYCSARLETTCSWVDSHPAYQSWLSGQADKTLQVLWVHGPAGFGKSVLSAYIIKSLLDSGRSPVYSFFCSGASDAQKNPTAIPRSWVYQAVHQSDDILDIVLQYLEKCENHKATHSDIVRLLRDILVHSTDAIFIVDGLDECPRMSTSRTDLHRNRADILRELIAEAAGTETRLLVVSREEGDIRAQLRPYGPIVPGVNFGDLAISRDSVSTDIARFAEHIVTQKLPGNTDQFRQGLAAQMAEKSDGMFLLIRLQSQNLRPRKGKKQLQQAVNDMPTSLVQVYERHWEDIQRLPSPDRQRAEAILRWVIFARRPLRIMELAEAVTVLDTDEETPQFDDLPDPFDMEYVDLEILGLCGAFLELRSPPAGWDWHFASVQPIHFSATEFLTGQHEHAPFSDTTLHEYHLAKDCLRFLDCGESWLVLEDEDRGGVRTRSFLNYAVCHWVDHVTTCANSVYDIDSRVLGFFDQTNSNWNNWRDCFEEAEFDDSGEEDLAVETSDREESSDDGSKMKKLEQTNSEDLSTDSESDDEEIESTGSETAPLYSPETLDHSPGERTYYAARFGLTTVLQYLHRIGILDVSKPGGYFGSPLHAAALEVNTDALRLLLEFGADPQVKGRYGSALHAAVIGNQNEAVTVLLRSGASTTAVDDLGMTPLSRSAQMGYYTITQNLLNNGSDMSVCDYAGWGPLAKAVFAGHLDIVKLLVERGADLNAMTNHGETPLFWAVYKGHVGIVDYLISKGADQTVYTEESTPLRAAVEYRNLEIVNLLLRHITGAPQSAKPKYLDIALDWAVYNGDYEIADILCNSNADLSYVDHYGATALIRATKNKLPELVRILLQHGADITAIDHDGWDALLWAAYNGDIDNIQILLRHARDRSSCTADHESLSFQAWINGQVSTEILIGGAKPLLLAATYGHTEVVRLLLESGADISASTERGQTALHLACGTGYVEVVNLLLKDGANVNAIDKSGCTPLHYAFKSGHDTVAKVLVENRASMDTQTCFGRTPIQHASAEFRNRFPGWDRYSDSQPNEESRQNRLRESIYTLAGTTAVPLKQKDFVLLDVIGRCLLLLNDAGSACVLFDETMQIEKESGKLLTHKTGCKRCMKVIFDQRYLCTSCDAEHLCVPCMEKYRESPENQSPPCTGHEFFRVPSDDWDPSRQTDVYTEEFAAWLKELAVRYQLAAL